MKFKILFDGGRGKEGETEMKIEIQIHTSIYIHTHICLAVYLSIHLSVKRKTETVKQGEIETRERNRKEMNIFSTAQGMLC